MLRPNILIHGMLSLGGVTLLMVLTLTSAMAIQSNGESSDPCEQFRAGNILLRGVQTQFVEPESPEILVRPGEKLQFSFRYDICAVAPLPRLSGELRISQNDPIVEYLDESVSLVVGDASDHQATERVESADRPVAFSAQDVDKESTVSLGWNLTVSDCATVGTRASVAVSSEIDFPTGEQLGDGSYEIRSHEDVQVVTVVVAAHPATRIQSYTSQLAVTDDTVGASETLHFDLRVLNDGTVALNDMFLGFDASTALGRGVIASIYNTYQAQRFLDPSDGSDVSAPPYIDDDGLFRFRLKPQERIVFTWRYTVPEDARSGDTIAVDALIMHDDDGDRILRVEETMVEAIHVAVEARGDGLKLTQRALDAAGRTNLYSDSLVDFEIYVRNAATTEVQDAVVALDLPVGLRYVQQSASYALGQEWGPNARRLHDGWVENGFVVDAIDPGEEVVVSYRAYISDELAVPGDVIQVSGSAQAVGYDAIGSELALAIASRAHVTVTVDGPDSMVPGGEGQYVVELTNRGDGPLSDVLFAVDMACGVTYVPDSEWIFTKLSEPVRGGVGFGSGSVGLAEYLVDTSRDDPFVLDRPIEPGETIQVSFKIMVEEDVLAGSTLVSLFHVLGWSGDGYELMSTEHQVAVGSGAATSAELEAATESILAKISDPEFLIYEALAAVVGVLVGLVLGYVFRKPIAAVVVWSGNKVRWGWSRWHD